MEAKFILLVALFCLGLKSVTPKIEVPSPEEEIERLQNKSPADLSRDDLDSLDSLTNVFVEARVAELVEKSVIRQLERRSEIVSDKANRNKRAVKKVTKTGTKEDSTDVNSSPSFLERIQELVDIAEMERVVDSATDNIMSERIAIDMEPTIREKRASVATSPDWTVDKLASMLASVNSLRSDRLLSNATKVASKRLEREGILAPE